MHKARGERNFMKSQPSCAHQKPCLEGSRMNEIIISIMSTFTNCGTTKWQEGHACVVCIHIRCIIHLLFQRKGSQIFAFRKWGDFSAAWCERCSRRRARRSSRWFYLRDIMHAHRKWEKMWKYPLDSLSSSPYFQFPTYTERVTLSDGNWIGDVSWSLIKFFFLSFMKTSSFTMSALNDRLLEKCREHEKKIDFINIEIIQWSFSCFFFLFEVRKKYWNCFFNAPLNN